MQIATKRIPASPAEPRPRLSPTGEKVREIIADVTFRCPADISLEMRLDKDLKVDDIDMSEILFELEQWSGCDIDDIAVCGVSTVDDLISFVDRRILQVAEAVRPLL